MKSDEFVRVPGYGPIPDFEIGAVPVTQGFWTRHGHLLPVQPTKFTQEHPVVSVSWDEAMGFAQRLGCRLPSPEEYALLETLLAGSEAFREDPDAFVVTGLDECPPVASRRALEVMLPWQQNTPQIGTSTGHVYDILGPVYEWTSAEESASNRVSRGGSWSSGPPRFRVAFRYRDSPSFAWTYLGLRRARDVPR